LILSFGISIITTPINLVAMWGFYSKYFHMMGSLKMGAPEPRMTAEMLRSFGLGIGIVTCASQLLTLMVQPLITTVLYFDSRTRRGEFFKATLPEPPLTEAGGPA